MPEFVYEAKTRTGELRKGTREADNEESVSAWLRAQQLLPGKVKRKPKALTLSFGSGVTPKDLVLFTRQFGTMIDAGIPLVQCLDILSSQNENPLFARVLRDVKSNVEQGKNFSESLARHPKVFDHMFVNLIRAGEVGGILDTIMQRLALYIEKRAKLGRQVRGAMTYPASVLIIAIVVVSVLLTFVIPTFEKMFRDFGAADELPGLTKFVIGLSRGFAANFVYIATGAALVAFGVVRGYRTARGREFVHRALLQLPIMGPVIRKIAVARFTRTLGTLLGAGVPILEAMDIVATSAGNVVIEKAILDARSKIAEGKPMSEPLMATKVFPTMVVQMIGVGEQTGALDAMLNKIADYYEDEVDIAVASMTAMLEPIMMVTISGLVGVMMIAMYLPIFEIAGKVKAQ